MKFSPIRPGVTLIELLLFVGIIGIVGVTVLPIFFTATDSRLLQQTMSMVEQNGQGLLQILERRIRESERILDPPIGETGAVLALQTNSGSTSPIIFATRTGSLIIIRRATKQVLSSSQVAVTNFRVRNTSTDANHPSVTVSFTISRTVRLQLPKVYSRSFETAVTLFPDDVETEECGCLVPACGPPKTYTWGICNAIGDCSQATTQLQCP
jgi:type II secretory pathway pseudopilin PulG